MCTMTRSRTDSFANDLHTPPPDHRKGKVCRNRSQDSSLIRCQRRNTRSRPLCQSIGDRTPCRFWRIRRRIEPSSKSCSSPGLSRPRCNQARRDLRERKMSGMPRSSLQVSAFELMHQIGAGERAWMPPTREGKRKIERSLRREVGRSTRSFGLAIRRKTFVALMKRTLTSFFYTGPTRCRCHDRDSRLS